MKRWATGIGILIVFALAILLLLPFVSLNRYKPQFQEQLAKHLNGRLDFSHAHLTVLTGLGVELENVSISNTSSLYLGQKVIQADRLKLRFELGSLLKRQLKAHVELIAPKLDVQKGLEKNSFTTLFKINELSAPSQPGNSAPANNAPPQPQLKQPSILESAVVSSLKFTDAGIEFTDTRMTPPKRLTSVSNLSLSLFDIGYNREMSVIAHLMVDDSLIQGPIETTIKLRAENRENKFEKLLLSGKIDGTQAVLRQGDWFLKNAGVPLRFEFDGTATPDQLELPDFKLVLADAAITGLLTVSDYLQMQARLALSLSELELTKLKSVLVRHGEFIQDGKISFQGDLEGSVYGIQPLRLRGDLKIVALNSDAQISILSLDARKKKFDVTLRSAAVNLDSWLDPIQNPKKEPEKAISDAISTESAPLVSEVTPSVPTTQLNEQGSQHPPISEKLTQASEPLFEVNFNAQSDSLAYKQTTAKDVMFIGVVTNGGWKIERLSMKGFGGSLQTRGTILKLDASRPFDMQLSLSRINPSEVSKAFGDGSESEPPFNGRVDVQSNFKGNAQDVLFLLDTLEGQGTYVVSEGGASSRSVALAIQKDLEKKIGQLPVAKGLGKLDSLLQNERVQELAKKNNLEIDKLRKDIGDIRTIKIVDESSIGSKLTGVRGEFTVKNRNIQFDTKNVHDSGRLFLESNVSFDSRVQGKGRYEFSQSFKDKMLSQTQQVRHLFDTDGSLIVEFSLGGTINDPQVDIAFQKLVDRFERNSGRSVEEDAKKIIDDLMKGDSRKKIDSLKEKLKKQLEKNKIRIPGM